MWHIIPRSVENSLHNIHIIYLISNFWIINALSEQKFFRYRLLIAWGRMSPQWRFSAKNPCSSLIAKYLRSVNIPENGNNGLKIVLKLGNLQRIDLK